MSLDDENNKAAEELRGGGSTDGPVTGSASGDGTENPGSSTTDQGLGDSADNTGDSPEDTDGGSDGIEKKEESNINIPEFENPSAANIHSEGGHRPGDVQNPAVKKAAAIYIVVIIVLVGVVITMAILFFTRIFGKDGDSKDPSATPVPTQSISVTDAPTSTPELTPGVSAGDGDGGDGQLAWNENKDYGVVTTLGQYLGMEGTLTYAEVTEEDIDNELTAFAASHSTSEEVTDRSDVREGDTVNVDYVGRIDGEEFNGGTASDFELEIGAGGFIDGFEEGMVGMAVGETKDLDLKFPDVYEKSPDLAGKPVVFTVTVNSIKEEVVPELTDEFIAANTDYTTLADYRLFLAEDLLQQRKDEANENMRYNVIEQIISNCTFEGGIDEEIADYTEYYMDYYDQMSASIYGIDGATLFAYFYGFTEDQYREYMQSEAAYSIKYQHVLDAVIEDQAMSLTDEEFETFFNETFIDYYGYASKEEAYADNGQEEVDEYVNSNGLRDKAEKLILDSVIIKEVITPAE